MTCHDARQQLPAHLDGALSDPERQALDGHLETCADCGRELDQLLRTVALLGRIPPVHAPAGFVDRVMAEAYRPSWPRRLVDTLFRPLRVKLPLEAAAVVLVGVSALYVYQHAPEVRQLARQETREPSPAPRVEPPTPAAPPVAGVAGEPPRVQDLEPETKRVPVEREGPRVPAPLAAPGVATPPPTPVPPAATTQRANALEAPAAKTGAKPAPTSEPRAEVKPEAKMEALGERRPDGSGSAPAPGTVERFARSAEPSPSRDAAGASAPPAEGRGRLGGVASAPSAAPAPEGATGDAAKRRAAAPLMRAVDASGRLTVPAREPAEAALDALVGRLGATRAARRLEGAPGMVLIDVVVPGARYRELVEGLARIGRWVTEYEADALPAEVRVEIALTVGP